MESDKKYTASGFLSVINIIRKLLEESGNRTFEVLARSKDKTDHSTMQAYNPYTSPDAHAYSSYATGLSGMPVANKNRDQQALLAKTAKQLHHFFLYNNHPCIIARSCMRAESFRFGVYPGLGSKEATAGLSRDLISFIHDRQNIKHPYATFMAVFQQPLKQSEEAFEKALWKQLSLLHASSKPFYNWDPKTSSDPSENEFGFSFGGKAFYIVGMHPNSSRKSRQFAQPMLVFNLHEQFESLRSKGSYEKIKAVVRKNDMQLQGSINPMLADFGKSSEAKQYSGRAVSEAWKCPFLASLS